MEDRHRKRDLLGRKLPPARLLFRELELESQSARFEFYLKVSPSELFKLETRWRSLEVLSSKLESLEGSIVEAKLDAYGISSGILSWSTSTLEVCLSLFLEGYATEGASLLRGLLEAIVTERYTRYSPSALQSLIDFYKETAYWSISKETWPIKWGEAWDFLVRERDYSEVSRRFWTTYRDGLSAYAVHFSGLHRVTRRIRWGYLRPRDNITKTYTQEMLEILDCYLGLLEESFETLISETERIVGGKR